MAWMCKARYARLSRGPGNTGEKDASGQQKVYDDNVQQKAFQGCAAICKRPGRDEVGAKSDAVSYSVCRRSRRRNFK